MRLRRAAEVPDRLVTAASGFFGRRLTRRGFISRATVAGTAVAATGCAVITQPGSPYTAVTSCPPGTLCRDGYTEFCCVINSGLNACPSGTFPAGWWRADYSVYCNGTRYYIDCNDFSGAAPPCHCAEGCDRRKVYCNHFRYGQCNQGIPGTGVIACRVVTCTPPYLIAGAGCSPSDAVDNSTAGHHADCPPPPPPPLVSAPVIPSLGSAVAFAPGEVSLLVRGADGSVWRGVIAAGVFAAWEPLSATSTSRALAVTGNGSEIEVFVRSGNGGIWRNHRVGGTWAGWQSLGGVATSDPAVAVGPAGIDLVVRGTDQAMYGGRLSGSTFDGWEPLHGALTSNPAVAVGPSGTARAFVRGTDGAIHENERTATGWSGFRSLEGRLTSDPATALAGSELHLFARGTDDAIHTRRITGGAWTAWESLGGAFTSDPVAVAEGGDVSVFARATSGNVWHRRRTGGVYQQWETLPVGTTANPAAVSDGTRLWVFVTDGAGSVSSATCTAGVWSGWSAMPGLAVAPMSGAS
ncbi:MAG: hypothetical protein WEC34_14235 [Acidimicrobiia bacterium]